MSAHTCAPAAPRCSCSPTAFEPWLPSMLTCQRRCWALTATKAHAGLLLVRLLVLLQTCAAYYPPPAAAAAAAAVAATCCLALCQQLSYACLPIISHTGPVQGFRQGWQPCKRRGCRGQPPRLRPSQRRAQLLGRLARAAGGCWLAETLVGDGGRGCANPPLAALTDSHTLFCACVALLLTARRLRWQGSCPRGYCNSKPPLTATRKARKG